MCNASCGSANSITAGRPRISRALANAAVMSGQTFSPPRRSMKPELIITCSGWVCGALRIKFLPFVRSLRCKSSSACKPVASIASTLRTRRIRISGSCLARFNSSSSLSTTPKKKAPKTRKISTPGGTS